MESFSKAATNRSIRTIRTELEFLHDSSLLTASQLSSIVALLPDAPESAASRSSGSNGVASNTARLAATSLGYSNTATNGGGGRQPSPQPPQQPQRHASPPSYSQSGPAALATASALYVYNPTDSGDMGMQPNDRVFITEYMNADWAKGRNERTGQEGIFPRSYVQVVADEGAKKGWQPPPPSAPAPSNYGNMPVDVASGAQQQPSAVGAGSSKMNEQGKKFGKKLGNAAIFGAGATIGSNVVNSIF